MCVLLSFLGFWFVWEDRAINIELRTDRTSLVGENGTTYFAETSLSFENYVLGRRGVRLNFVHVGLNETLPPAETTLDNAKDFATFNLTLRETSSQLLYGSEPLSGKNVRTGWNLTRPHCYDIPGLTRLVVTMEWSWSSNESAPGYVFLDAERDDGCIFRLVESEPYPLWDSFPARYLSRSILLPTAFFSLGFLLEVRRRNLLDDLSESYKYLSQLRQGADERLEQALKDLIHQPRLMNYAEGAFFGAALTIFKILTRRIAEAKSSESELKSYWWDSSLREFLKDEAMQPGSSLFEAKTIALITGFLASIGLSFSWNFGAMGPLFLVIGLSYLSWNLGAVAYLVREHSPSLRVVGSALGVVIAALAFPIMIIDFRAYAPWQVFLVLAPPAAAVTGGLIVWRSIRRVHH